HLVRMADFQAAPAVHRYQVVEQARIDAGRAAGLRLAVLEGDAEVERGVALARGIDDGVVGDQGILRRVQADPRPAGPAHQVVAHHAAHGLVPARVHRRVEVFRTGV